MWAVTVFIRGMGGHNWKEVALKSRFVHSPWVNMLSTLVAGIINTHLIQDFLCYTLLSQMKGVRIARTNLFGFYVYSLHKIKKLVISLKFKRKISLQIRFPAMFGERMNGWNKAFHHCVVQDKELPPSDRQEQLQTLMPIRRRAKVWGTREEKHKHCAVCQDWPPGLSWLCLGCQQWNVNMGHRVILLRPRYIHNVYPCFQSGKEHMELAGLFVRPWNLQ